MTSDFDKLLTIVKEQTKEFKIQFMESAKVSITNEFRSLPKKISAINKRINDLCLKEKEISKSYTNECGTITDMKKFNEARRLYKPLWKEHNKLRSMLSTYRKYVLLGEEKYVTNELNKAETTFDGKVLGLATKLDKKLFSPDNIIFSSISSDPKLFDVFITSGSNKVHARSVLAAVDSECMVAHFRFIITNAK